jgi:hypothetical protein
LVRQLAVVFTVALATWQAGCGSDDAIRYYRIPKEHLLHAANRVENRSRSAAEDAVGFKQPDGWVREPRDRFSQLAFGVRDGDQSARITVSVLARDSGGLLANLNRWRDQVGLGQLSEETMETACEAFEIQGFTGHYVEFVSPDEVAPSEAIYGWIGLLPDSNWFVKMRGDARLVQRERDAFRGFLKSLEVFASDGAGNAEND